MARYYGPIAVSTTLNIAEAHPLTAENTGYAEQFVSEQIAQLLDLWLAGRLAVSTLVETSIGTELVWAPEYRELVPDLTATVGGTDADASDMNKYPQSWLVDVEVQVQSSHTLTVLVEDAEDEDDAERQAVGEVEDCYSDYDLEHLSHDGVDSDDWSVYSVDTLATHEHDER